MPSKDLYARLELVSPEPAKKLDGRSRLTDIRHRLGRWGAALLQYFSGSQAPRIAVKRNPYGYGTFYEIYDPVDGAYHTFDTELEVRVWLEQRYYQ